MAAREPEEKREEESPDGRLSSSESQDFARAESSGIDLSKTYSTRSAKATTNLDRVVTGALDKIRSRKPIPPFHHRLEHKPTTIEALVDFDGPDDPYRPVNWPIKKKVITTVLYGFTTMTATFASSVFSPAIGQVSERFHISREVSTLGISLLLLGFGIGPLLWAPLSEVYGRKMAVLPPLFIAGVFSFGSGAAKDVQTLMITRFFTGFFGSAPVTNSGGVMGDLYQPETRGLAMVGYAMAIVGGPTLGPIVGSAIVTSYLRWRWTEYITGIFTMLMLTLDVIFIDESYPPMLLVYKARRLRHETGNWALHAEHEEWDVSLRELSRKYLIRPFQILRSPIAMLVSLYASFCYGILYAQLSAIPIEFEEERGWKPVVASLPFLALLLGIFLAAGTNILNQKYYIKKFHANNNRAVPEARLPPMMLGSVIFCAGLFMFAWTSSKHVFWLCPCIACVLLGMGFFAIYQAALNYLVDTFTKYSASAIGGNTFMRGCFAAAFPLFITPMLHNMGIDWGVSVFGFVAAALIPVPFFFFVYGKRIRAKGEYSRPSV